MKKILSTLLVITLLFSSLLSTVTYATGDGNMEGGGGDMGGGTGQSFWNPGNDGVRVSIVRDSDKAVVGATLDLTNKKPQGIFHFNKVAKLHYSSGRGLAPNMTGYTYQNPTQPLPRIISSSGGNNIAAVKSYFTDEQVLRSIAQLTGIEFDVMIAGQYKLLVEPLAYFKFEGINMAMTATEAALYDEQVNGKLRTAMGFLTHQNLPFAIFLETPDLGYPAYSGATSNMTSNATIKSQLGLGIVRFKELPPQPEVDSYDYEYRVDTEVITPVWVTGGQSDPDHPTTVRFQILGRTYTVSNVYYPDGDSQLVWVRWKTPPEEQNVVINVSMTGPGNVEKAVINCKIVDLDKNPPPNPVADDRNDSFRRASVPNKEQKTSASWGVWSPWWQEYWVWVPDWQWESEGCDSGCDDDCSGGHGSWEDYGEWEDQGWWEFDWNAYSASLRADMEIKTDDRNPTAHGGTMKSGYGLNETVTASVSTNQSSAVTAAQNAVSYFPEFRYGTYWRLLDRMRTGYSAEFEFKQNHYSTYKNRTHFSPIWYPDGSYKVYTWLIDCWTPDGMLSMNLTDSLTVDGNLWMDWHSAIRFLTNIIL